MYQSVYLRYMIYNFAYQMVSFVCLNKSEISRVLLSRTLILSYSKDREATLK